MCLAHVEASRNKTITNNVVWPPVNSQFLSNNDRAIGESSSFEKSKGFK